MSAPTSSAARSSGIWPTCRHGGRLVSGCGGHPPARHHPPGPARRLRGRRTADPAPAGPRALRSADLGPRDGPPRSPHPVSAGALLGPDPLHRAGRRRPRFSRLVRIYLRGELAKLSPLEFLELLLQDESTAATAAASSSGSPSPASRRRSRPRPSPGSPRQLRSPPRPRALRPPLARPARERDLHRPGRRGEELLRPGPRPHRLPRRAGRRLHQGRSVPPRLHASRADNSFERELRG